MQLGIMDGVTALSEELFVSLDLGAHSVKEQGLNALFHGLQSGDFEVILAPLSELPSKLPEDLAITALSKRGNPAWRLAIPSAIAKQGVPLMLEAGTSIAGNEIALAQLLQLREDLVKGEWGAKIFPWWQKEAGGIHQQDLQWIDLQPRELIPLPGSGVIAMICRKNDVGIRTEIQKFHHPETMLVTNVERSFLRLLSEKFDNACFAWCEKDTLGNYRLWAGCLSPNHQVLKAQRTYNTYTGLAEAIANDIQLNLTV